MRTFASRWTWSLGAVLLAVVAGWKLRELTDSLRMLRGWRY
jgi:hypothetical protein